MPPGSAAPVDMIYLGFSSVLKSPRGKIQHSSSGTRKNFRGSFNLEYVIQLPAQSELQKWLQQISHIFPIRLLNHRHFGPKLLQHERFENFLDVQFANFYFFPEASFVLFQALGLIIIKIDLQILGQKLLLYYLHFLMFLHSNNAND